MVVWLIGATMVFCSVNLTVKVETLEPSGICAFPVKSGEAVACFKKFLESDFNIGYKTIVLSPLAGHLHKD